MLNNPITEPQIPSTIARDREIEEKIEAHVSTFHPHPEYKFLQKSKTIPGSVSYPENVWTSLGVFPGFSWGKQGAPSLVAVGINFSFSIFPWQQACCGALLAPVWWQPAFFSDEEGTSVPLEIHNARGSKIKIRLGALSEDTRDLLISPENLITIPPEGRVDIIVIKFF